jgi:hypothetical protein
LGRGWSFLGTEKKPLFQSGKDNRWKRQLIQWEEDEVFWGQRRSFFFSPEKTIDGKDNWYNGKRMKFFGDREEASFSIHRPERHRWRTIHSDTWVRGTAHRCRTIQSNIQTWEVQVKKNHSFQWQTWLVQVNNN